jgi:hypothetical protein
MAAAESIALAKDTNLDRPEFAGQGYDELFAFYVGKVVPRLRESVRTQP